jgi:acyl-CoA synthetase (AMP-forming)/AMP-acid ligase II/acyl carrier protein
MAAAPSTLMDVLERRAELDPDQQTFTFLEDGEAAGGSLTPAALAGQARAIAAWLAEQGLSGQHVLLLFPQGLAFVSAFFGCIYAGAVAVPAPMPHPRRLARTLPRLQGMIADARPAAILTDREGVGLAGSILEHLPEHAARIRWLVLEDCPPEIGSAFRRPDLSPERPAHLQYTSGSTSSPKGTIITHGNVLASSLVIREHKRYSRQSRGVVWVPHFHDDGLVHGLIQPLYTGYPTVLFAASAFVARPARWLWAIHRFGATHAGGPNFAYDLCVRKVSEADAEAIDLSTWSFAYNAAEPVRWETLRRFHERFGPRGFRFESFAPCYGLAEATLTVSVGASDGGPHVVFLDARALERTGQAEEVAEGTPGARPLVSAGRPVTGAEVAVVDPDTGARCPAERAGEILIKSPCVAAGYLNLPDESRRIFRAYLEAPVDGPYLRTGDQGFLRDGEIFITGRLKDLIIIRGENRYPEDIEWTVERSHPDLAPGGCAAFSVEAGGEERLVIFAEVKRRAGPDVADPAGFDAVLSAIRLAVSAEHDLRPHAVVLLAPDQLPKTSSGKIQRRGCRGAFLEGPRGELARWMDPMARSDEPPADWLSWITDQVLEETAHLLRVDTGRIDSEASFASLGLDSLMEMELRGRLKARFGLDLPAMLLFAQPGAAALARYLAGRVGRASDGSPAPVSEALLPRLAPSGTGAHPVSPGQARLLFFERLLPGSPVYNLQTGVRTSGPLDVEALRRSLEALALRHTALRTTFHEEGGELVARVAGGADVALPVIDLSGWAVDRRPAEIARATREHGRAPFDLARGPLWRAMLIEAGEGEHVLLWSQHHTVVDGWSITILLRELVCLYRAFTAGELPSLPALPVEPADHAAFQRAARRDPRHGESLACWPDCTGSISPSPGRRRRRPRSAATPSSSPSRRSSPRRPSRWPRARGTPCSPRCSGPGLRCSRAPAARPRSRWARCRRAEAAARSRRWSGSSPRPWCCAATPRRIRPSSI